MRRNLISGRRTERDDLAATGRLRETQSSGTHTATKTFVLCRYIAAAASGMD
jgi:hypothetical protein